MTEKAQFPQGTKPDHLFSDDTDLKHPHEGEAVRFYDNQFNSRTVMIMPGAHYVTSRKKEILMTTLGSCVCACVRDTYLGIGGLNHFMLPEDLVGKWFGAAAALRYGNHAMETLINDVLALGGAKNRLEIKIFGGSNVPDSIPGVGKQNISFLQKYLLNEQMVAESEHLGGDQSRRIIYFPDTGLVKMKLLPHSDDKDVLERDGKLRSNLNQKEIEGSSELF